MTIIDLAIHFGTGGGHDAGHGFAKEIADEVIPAFRALAVANTVMTPVGGRNVLKPFRKSMIHAMSLFAVPLEPLNAALGSFRWMCFEREVEYVGNDEGDQFCERGMSCETFVRVDRAAFIARRNARAATAMGVV